ncbi:uncharacterized protein V1513DRAFT_448868 [Lipomyces chichibuensis]|uniref:uncharacterized protein n=1 Tax=Lipomyces chichibuensis TaxID=1546026 RepID=UPI003343E74D
MLLSLVATVISLLWLLRRATQLLQIPIPTLVQLLGIDIPSPPHVCLDSVTSDSVTLHWSLPDRATSVAKHVIQMNGQNVGESEKRETTVTITGLNPDQVYGVRVLAVNSNHYSAAGQLIRLRTRRKSEDLVLTNIQPIPGESPDSPDKHISHSSESTLHGKKSDPPAVHTQFKRGSRSNRHSSPTSRDRSDSSSFTAATQPYTIESLAAELEQIRSEIIEIIAQHAHAEEEYATAEATLQAELEMLREKRKEEDAVRSQLRSETKALEESKRNLDSQKSKVERAVKHKTEVIEKIANDFVKWETERRQADERKISIEKLTEELENDTKEKARQNREVLHQGHKDVAELEDEIRGLIAKVKKAEIEKNPHTGDSSENAFAKLLHAEDAEDMKLEKAWQEVQKSLELRYLDVFQQYRDAEEKFRKAQEALATFMQSAVSPVDASKSARRRNRTRNKGRQPVSAPIMSYPLHDPRFPDASTFNDLQFNQLHAGGMRQSVSPTSASSDGNNTSSGSLPLIPFSMNAPTNFFSAPLDALDISTSEDLLTNGGPISPSVDMLLPSNLFVTDDLPQDLPDTLKDDDIDIVHTRSITEGSELSVDANFMFLSALNQPSSPSNSTGPLLLSSPSPPPSSPRPMSSSHSSSGPPTSAGYISGAPFFPVASGLKNTSTLPSPPSLADSSPLLESLSITHSNSSGGGSSTHDILSPTSPPPGGSNLIRVLNASADDSDDNAQMDLHQLSTKSSASSNFSITKRSPNRRLMFGGVGGIASIGNIGSIGRKKDSQENGVPTPPAPLASDADDVILLNSDEPRTPGRRFVNLFSFSKRSSTSGPSGPVGQIQAATVQPPIGTRRRSGSFNSGDLDASGTPTRPIQASNGNSNTFGTGVGNLFASQVFSRRNGRSLWDFKSDNNNSGSVNSRPTW